MSNDMRTEDGARGGPAAIPELSTGVTSASRPMSPATWGWFIALIALTFATSFYWLDGGAGFEPTDCWVAQTAREMLEADEWVVPVFANEIRMQKSPGPYWAVMFTSLVCGGEVTEATTRIPNGFAAVIIVGTIFWLTRRIAGDRAAVFAGGAAAGSAFILYWSHRGASDFGLTAFTTLSLACFWIAFADTPRGAKRNWLILLGYFSAGLGMLYKMPMPAAVVGVPMFCYVLLRNRWKDLIHWAHLVGVVLFLAPLAVWIVPVLQSEPTALMKWKVEFFDRFTGALPNVADQQTDTKMYFMYLLAPLIYCLPFSLSLPTAILRGFRSTAGVNRDGRAFLLIWFFSLLVFFTAAAGKEMRYFLVALPPLFALLGLELSLLFDPKAIINRSLVKTSAWAVWILVPVGFAGAVYAIYDKWYPNIGEKDGFTWVEVLRPLVVMGVIFAFGAGLSAWFFLRDRRNLSFGALVGTMIATWLWAWPALMPVMVSQRAFVDLADQMRARLTPEMQEELRFIGTQDSRLIWQSDIRTPRLIDQLDLLDEQEGTRSLAYEKGLYALTMVRQLAGDERVLYVLDVTGYNEFLGGAPVLLEALGESAELPETHVWMTANIGPYPRMFLIFSNKPRPADWPEPREATAERQQAKAADKAREMLARPDAAAALQLLKRSELVSGPAPETQPVETPAP